MATTTYGDKRKAAIEPVRVLGVELTRTAPGATIDGVAMAAGDSVADAGADGVGIFDFAGAASALTRRDDRPSGDCDPGTTFFVEEGTVYGGCFVSVGSDGQPVVFRATPRCNYAATTAPGVGDDEADGYEVGSLWLDTVGAAYYVCGDATEGAAVWIELAQAV